MLETESAHAAMQANGQISANIIPEPGSDLHALNGFAQSPDPSDGISLADKDEPSVNYAVRGTSHEQEHLLLAGEVDTRGIPLATTEYVDELNIERPRSGMKSAFMNMANSIIGAGIIGQPYAFRQAGLLTGIILLVGLTIIVDWTIHLIVINSKLSGARSFQETVERCYGKPGLVTISLAQWAFAFGGMIAFSIIIGDTIPSFLRGIFPTLPTTPLFWLLTDRRAIILILMLGVSYPLSLYRDISKLAKASGLALLSMLIIVVAVVSQGLSAPPQIRGNVKDSMIIGDNVTSSIGIISFAFVCHHNSLLIYGSLEMPTLDRFAQVTHYSTVVSMIACMILAISGFLTFGDKTLGNVLNNFPPDNTFIAISRLCFGLNMLSTLPLECFVCREVMLNYWCSGKGFDLRLHVMITTALVVTSTVIALLVCDVGALFNLVGSTSACMLAYILPPLCYIKLSTRSWRTYAAGLCASAGFAVMLMSLYQTITGMLYGKSVNHACS